MLHGPEALSIVYNLHAKLEKSKMGVQDILVHAGRVGQ